MNWFQGSQTGAIGWVIFRNLNTYSLLHPNCSDKYSACWTIVIVSNFSPNRTCLASGGDTPGNNYTGGPRSVMTMPVVQVFYRAICFQFMAAIIHQQQSLNITLSRAFILLSSILYLRKINTFVPSPSHSQRKNNSRKGKHVQAMFSWTRILSSKLQNKQV